MNVCGLTARTRPLKENEDAPRQHQSCVKPRPLLKRTYEGFFDKATVIEINHHRACYHDFFAEHSQRTQKNGDGLPKNLPLGTQTPEERIKGSKIKKPRQKLCALNNIGHGMRLERMNKPKHSGRQRKKPRTYFRLRDKCQT